MNKSEKIIVNETEKDTRLDQFLQIKFPELSRNKIKILIEEGAVFLNGKIPTKCGIKLKDKDIIELEIPENKPLVAKAENIPLEIVYEDKDIAIINKPQGMVVHAGSGNVDKTLVNALLYHIKDLSGINGVLRPGIVHRLDKNTAGLLVVAKNDFAHKNLAKQIENKTCHRIYEAILEGNVKEDCGTIQTHISRHKKNRKIMAVCPENEGKIAITDFKVLNRFKGYSHLEFSLKTGRTHQIRVHSKEVLHCPIANDTEYGGHTPKVLTKKDEKSLGQYLIAKRLELHHPRTNQELVFEITPPKYFSDFLNRLKLQI